MASLRVLASTINKEIDPLASYIDKNQIPNPSYGVDGPPTPPILATNMKSKVPFRRVVFIASCQFTFPEKQVKRRTDYVFPTSKPPTKESIKSPNKLYPHYTIPNLFSLNTRQLSQLQ